jgi:hypothetical protein
VLIASLPIVERFYYDDKFVFQFNEEPTLNSAILNLTVGLPLEIGAGFMATNLENQLIDKVRALPPDKQEEALKLLNTLATDAGAEPNGVGADRKPIWELVEEINARLPADTWDDVPTDGSINLDHYLYGTPKQQS